MDTNRSRRSIIFKHCASFTIAYTSMFPSMQLFGFLQSLDSLSRHVSVPIGHHQLILFAKTVNNSDINFSYSYVFYYLYFTETYILTYLLTELSPSRGAANCSATSQHFMEPQGSITCSQEFSTCPFPEPYQSNPNHPILSNIVILSVQLRPGLSSGLIPSGFPTSILYAFLFPPFVLHTSSISFFFTCYKFYISASCCVKTFTK
jgi:hypothetical protein